MDASTLAQAAIERAKEEKVFCPPTFRRGLFTVKAYDNIDHSPSSVASQELFHGTAASMFELPSKGEPRFRFQT